jgi:hypothetical protein
VSWPVELAGSGDGGFESVSWPVGLAGSGDGLARGFNGASWPVELASSRDGLAGGLRSRSSEGEEERSEDGDWESEPMLSYGMPRRNERSQWPGTKGHRNIT